MGIGIHNDKTNQERTPLSLSLFFMRYSQIVLWSLYQMPIHEEQDRQ